MLEGLASPDDPEDVAFLHDNEVLTVDLHFGAGPFAEQDLVAGLDVQRRDLALFRLGASADGDDFAFLRLFLDRVGNDYSPGGFVRRLDPTDQHAIMQWTKCHSYSLQRAGR